MIGSKKVRLRMAFAYSNMPRHVKQIWNDYKEKRVLYFRSSDLVNELPIEKPRYKFCSEEKRFKIQPDISARTTFLRESTKHWHRMTELAKYLYHYGYIAPDFKESDLKMKSRF